MKLLFIFFLFFMPQMYLNAGQKIFGIGLSHTGTRSLTAALEELGYKIAHYPQDTETQEDIMDLANWDLRLLKQVDGITDITVAPYYVQLHQTFPDAKFILTIRDKESWLKGCKRHWETHLMDDRSDCNFRKFLRAAVYGTYAFDRARFSTVYDKHLINVLEYFASYPNSLLVFNICEGDSWGPLCKFLKKPLPVKMFPHVGQHLP